MAPGTAPPSIVEQLSGMGKVRSAWLDESRRAPDAGADAAADRDAEAPPVAHDTPAADVDTRAQKKSSKKKYKKKRAREETAAGASSDSSGGYASDDEASVADAAQGEGKSSKKGKSKSKSKKKGKKRARVDSGGDSGYDEEEESAEERGDTQMDAAPVHAAEAAVGQEEGEEELREGGTAAHVRALEAWLDTREAKVSLPARKDIAKLAPPAQRAFAEHMGDASMRAVLALQQLLEMSAALVESGADGDGTAGGGTRRSGGRAAAHGKLSDVMLHEIETNRSLPERRQFVEMGLWRRAHRISTALCKPVHVLLRTARTEEAAAAAEAAATATFADVYNAAFAGTFGDEVERLGEVDGQRLSALLDAVQQSGHMLADVEKQLMVRQHAKEHEAET